MARLLLITNSDFGVRNTIGARALPVAEEARRRGMDVTVYCRGSSGKHPYPVVHALPLGRPVMRALSAIPIYVMKRFPAEAVKNALFDAALVIRLRGQRFDVVHSWDFLPRTYAMLRRVNPRVRIFQDVAMALPNVLTDIKDRETLFRGESPIVPPRTLAALRASNKVIVPSKFVRESVMRAGVSAKRIVVIPFGVDSKRFQPRKVTR